MTNGIEGKIVLITGGSTGIGAETARLLAERGAKVAIAARRKDRLDEVVADIAAAGGTARSYALDVTDKSAVQSVVAAIIADFGRLDVLPERLLAQREEASAPPRRRACVTAHLASEGRVTQDVVPVSAELDTGGRDRAAVERGGASLQQRRHEDSGSEKGFVESRQRRSGRLTWWRIVWPPWRLRWPPWRVSRSPQVGERVHHHGADPFGRLRPAQPR